MLIYVESIPKGANAIRMRAAKVKQLPAVPSVRELGPRATPLISRVRPAGEFHLSPARNSGASRIEGHHHQAFARQTLAMNLCGID
jgi:hypothetical protein